MEFELESKRDAWRIKLCRVYWAGTQILAQISIGDLGVEHRAELEPCTGDNNSIKLLPLPGDTGQLPQHSGDITVNRKRANVLARVSLNAYPGT